MAKNTISQYSKTAGSNTDVQSVSIAEGMAPSDVNNAMREIMVDLASLYDGTQSLGKLVIEPASAGSVTANVNADELVIENSGNTGISILSPDASSSRLYFGSPSTEAGVAMEWVYDTPRFLTQMSTTDSTWEIRVGAGSKTHEFVNGALRFPAGTSSVPGLAPHGDNHTGIFFPSNDQMGFATGGTERHRWNGAQVHFNDTSNANLAAGLSINQAANDDHIIDCKSSDVAHPFTGVVEADTYFKISKASSAGGSALLEGYSEGTGGVDIRGNYATASTSQATSSLAAVTASAYNSDGGSSRAAPGANDNIFGCANGANTKFLVKGDGDFYYDGADQGAYDAYDDAHISRALDLSRGKGVIDGKFDKFIAYNHEKLADMKLVGREEDGTPNHFINVAGMQRLHNGAIWQQYEKHENLLNAVYQLAVEAVGEDRADEILDKNDIKLLSKYELLN